MPSFGHPRDRWPYAPFLHKTADGSRVWAKFDPRVEGWWLPAEDYWWEQDQEEMVQAARCSAGYVYRDKTIWQWGRQSNRWMIRKIIDGIGFGAPKPSLPPSWKPFPYDMYRQFKIGGVFYHAERELWHERPTDG